MARSRSPNRDKAFEIFKEHNGIIKNRTIAEQLGISEKTVGGWKSKDKWLEKTSGVLQSNERSTPLTTSKKKGGQLRNQNAVGNKGGSAPKGNKNAVTHGFFAKWLPEESQEIMEAIQNRDQADMLWDSIMFQYTAIIRAQKIMFVQDQDDMTKEKTGESWGESGGGETFTVQFAWDKQVTFMNAQSRAMSELRSLIKQFISFADEADERRLKLDQMQTGLELTKAQLYRVKAENGDFDDEIIEDDGFMDAIKGMVTNKEVWPDED
ncbi:phage terminase small subunit [Carnobacterium mobile]|uniref:phage terminase small subunit n=1 Tax=Carnobacterium mobile TaxID=2750 RepID=UPI000551571D|nr:phage terminase small subunit [Carnobacterium mobile]